MYYIHSCKGCREIANSLERAIQIAKEFDLDKQPSFGTDLVNEDGETIAHFEGGKLLSVNGDAKNTSVALKKRFKA